MRDKLVIITTIQNILMHMVQLMGEQQTNRSPEKLGCLKGLSTILLDIYYAITGDWWNGSPKDLMNWMVKYIKDEADTLGGDAPKIRVSIN